MAIMIIFGKDLLKWHNMKDISYVLKFFIFNLQGIFFLFFFFFTKIIISERFYDDADVKLQLNPFKLTCRMGRVVFGCVVVKITSKQCNQNFELKLQTNEEEKHTDCFGKSIHLLYILVHV